MKPADYDAVFALWQACEGIGLNESDARRLIGLYLRRNRKLSLVAEVNDQLVGAVLCGHDGRRGYLHHLAVARGYRRRGIGRALVAECLARLHAEGIPKCNIFLFAANTAGRAFWLREGWVARKELVMLQKTTKPAAPAGRGS